MVLWCSSGGIVVTRSENIGLAAIHIFLSLTNSDGGGRWLPSCKAVACLTHQAAKIDIYRRFYFTSHKGVMVNLSIYKVPVWVASKLKVSTLLELGCLEPPTHLLTFLCHSTRPLLI